MRVCGVLVSMRYAIFDKNGIYVGVGASQYQMKYSMRANAVYKKYIFFSILTRALIYLQNSKNCCIYRNFPVFHRSSDVQDLFLFPTKVLCFVYPVEPIKYFSSFVFRATCFLLCPMHLYYFSHRLVSNSVHYTRSYDLCFLAIQRGFKSV